MHEIADLFHEPVLKGEKTPSLDKLHDLLLKHAFDDKVALPYALLRHLV